MYGLDEETVRWIEKQLNGQARNVELSGTRSSWKPVTMKYPRCQYVVPSYLTASSVVWMLGQSVPLASLLTTQN